MGARQEPGIPADTGRVPIFRAGLGRRLPPRYLRLGPLVAIPSLLADFGCDAAATMAGVGIPASAFTHPDNAIPFAAVCRLVSRCTEVTGREDFGLLIAETCSPSDLGLIGFLMKQAPDVRTALGDLVRYFHHHDSGAVPFLDQRDGVVVLGYAILEAPELGIEQVYDGAIAIACRILTTLCGPKWTPIEVTLAHRTPQHPARYERHFGAPVRFEAERSTIIFAPSWLDTKLPMADPALRDMLQEQVQLLEEQEAHNLAEKVRRLLRVALLSEGGSLDDVADMLQLSRRALERRLEEEGSSFRQLSDEVRYEIAMQYLESTSLSITQIGLALKFSEASAFSRAFRRWSGETPRAWRLRHASHAYPASA